MLKKHYNLLTNEQVFNHPISIQHPFHHMLHKLQPLQHPAYKVTNYNNLHLKVTYLASGNLSDVTCQSKAIFALHLPKQSLNAPPASKTTTETPSHDVNDEHYSFLFGLRRIDGEWRRLVSY